MYMFFLCKIGYDGAFMKRTPWIVVMRMLSKNPYNAFNINKTKHCNCLLSLETNIPSYSLKLLNLEWCVKLNMNLEPYQGC